MSSRLTMAVNKNLITPPGFVSGGLQYEVITGSQAYGCSRPDSDEDIYGFCMPPKEIVFPHITGHIKGFGVKPQDFEQYQQHHVFDGQDEYDFSIYSIVKFVNLIMECNPNMVDCLFVPQQCILVSTEIGEIIRLNRKLFLSKLCFPRFRGYAFSQKKKMLDKKPKGKRKLLVEKYGFDVNYASHIVRLMLECEQILTEGDLNLQRNSEILKSIRRGEWTQQRIIEWFEAKEISMETLYADSKLPYEPRRAEIKVLLMKCLEQYYGSLDKLVVRQGDCRLMAKEIKEVIGRYV